MRLLQLEIAMMMVVVPLAVAAQNRVNPEDREVDMDHLSFVPTVKMGDISYGGEQIPYIETNNVYVFPAPEFKNEKQRQKYNKLVYNVKKVLPIAKEANKIIIETYEYLETLPNKKAKDAHMKLVEKDIKERYTPRMKKLTYSQGKLLIKLIYRECNSSSYQLIQSFLGPVKAGFYQAFAWVFGASLKKDYDAQGEDKMTEQVVLQVEAGQL